MKSLKLIESVNVITLTEGPIVNWASRIDTITNLLKQCEPIIKKSGFGISASQKEILIFVKNSKLKAPQVCEFVGSLDDGKYSVKYIAPNGNESEIDVPNGATADSVATLIVSKINSSLPTLNKPLTEGPIKALAGVINKIATNKEQKKENNKTWSDVGRQLGNQQPKGIKFDIKYADNNSTLRLFVTLDSSYIYKISLAKNDVAKDSLVVSGFVDWQGNAKNDIKSVADALKVIGNNLHISLPLDKLTMAKTGSSEQNSSKGTSSIQQSQLVSQLRPEITNILFNQKNESLIINEALNLNNFKDAFSQASDDEKVVLTKLYLEDKGVNITNEQIINMMTSSISELGTPNNVYINNVITYVSTNSKENVTWCQALSRLVNSNVKLVKAMNTNPKNFSIVMNDTAWSNISDSQEMANIIQDWYSIYVPFRGDKEQQLKLYNIFVTNNKINHLDYIETNLERLGVDGSSIRNSIKVDISQKNIDGIINKVQKGQNLNDKEVMALVKSALNNNQNKNNIYKSLIDMIQVSRKSQVANAQTPQQ